MPKAKKPGCHSVEFSQPLPSDVEAEKMLLGAILADDSALAPVQELLTPDEFSVDSHKLVFQRICDMYERGVTISIQMLARELKEHEELETCGGLQYLVSLEVPKLTGETLGEFAMSVRNTAIRRKGIQQSLLIVQKLFDSKTADESLADAERVIAVLTESSNRRSRARTVGEIYAEAGGIQQFLSAERQRGVPLPWSRMHWTLGGLRRRKLTTVAARPAVGKSKLFHEICHHSARLGHKTVLATFEMSAEDVLLREIPWKARVNTVAFREGKLAVEQKMKLLESAEELAAYDTNLRFIDTVPTTMRGLRREVRSLKAAGEDIELVLIDYAQYVTPGDERTSRAQQVSTIMREAKSLAMEENLHVMAISTLARAPGQDETTEPELRELKESGDIEYFSDYVLFLWASRRTLPGETYTDIHWKAAKCKDGKQNRGILRFHKDLGYFEDLDDVPLQEPPEIRQNASLRRNGSNGSNGNGHRQTQTDFEGAPPFDSDPAASYPN